ncbi:peroxisomal membrane protein 11A [Silene latifolia]|uniref:peroxisomal membrane protein 11A n=1 Tax=Silene latifolia TaxID=37657 RepID=UPI003D78122E
MQPHQPQPQPLSDLPPPPPPPTPPSQPPLKPSTQNRDLLQHIEAYLSKRDGVDKLLKISRYTSKLLLSTSLIPSSHPVNHRLRSFESSVGLSRKAFRLGKFIQDVNALRRVPEFQDSKSKFILNLLCYGGEGVYYFIEQIVWISKSGLIDPKHAKNLQKFSAWAEFIGYIGSISLKIGDLKCLNDQLACLSSTVEISTVRGENCDEERGKFRVLEAKCLLKKMSIVQDLADAFMALSDIRDGKGRLLSSPLLLSGAGLLSALISTHKNWASC